MLVESSSLPKVLTAKTDEIGVNSTPDQTVDRLSICNGYFNASYVLNMNALRRDCDLKAADLQAPLIDTAGQ